MSRKMIAIVKNYLGNKLKIIRKSMNLTQQAFAKRLNTSAGYISEIESGKKKPGSDFLISLKRNYNIDIEWLLTGEGEMKKPLAKYENKEHDIEHVAEPRRGYYTGVTEKILIMLEKMTEEQRRDVLKYTEEKQLLEELLEERRSKKVS